MKRIILSRTDSIGDVVLTLPMAGVLKKHLPDIAILFLGRSYTQPVIESCTFVDEFVNWDEISTLSYKNQVRAFRALCVDAIIHVFMVAKIANLADSADIPIKIGTTHRLFTWLFCNQPVWFSRKQSDLHEAQFNLKLLKPLGIKVMLRREEIPDYYGLKVEGRGSRVEERRTKDEGRGIRNTKYEIQTQDPASGIEQPCHCEDPDYPGDAATASRFKLILHPKSKGSAREWGLENFSRLIGLLPKNRFRIYITGTKDEGEMMKEFLEKHRDDVTDMTGKMTLSEFMDFIRECDGLVAASTGPLHLAAAFGKVAVGLYAPMRPIYPTRWAPLGEKASYLVAEKECNDCRKGGDCHCMKDIRAEEVAAMFLSH